MKINKSKIVFFSFLTLAGSLFFQIPTRAMDFDTMLILGSDNKNKLVNRVNGAYNLIKAGNYNKIIASGGCVKKPAGTKGLTCPADCSDPNCTEASQIEKLLIAKDPSLAGKIVLENKSQNTNSNYKNSKGLISAGASVLVVSAHTHAKAVSYALSYCDGFNAFYFVIGESSDPQKLPIDWTEDSIYYRGIAAKCSGNPISSVTGPESSIGLFSEVKLMLQKPVVRIKIPGLSFTENKEVKDDTGSYIVIPFLGEYLAALYKYGVVVSAIFAVVMLINNGLKWSISGGSPEKIKDAQTRIFQSITGLLLAIGSYVLLFYINPELVQFKNLRVLVTPPTNTSEAKGFDFGYSGGTAVSPSCSDPNMIISDLNKIDFSLNGEYKHVQKKLTPEKVALYKQAVNAVPEANVPWEMLATIHFKECSMDSKRSILNGKALCNTENDGNLLSWCPECKNPTPLNDLICGVKLIRKKAKTGELSPANLELVKTTFCKFNGCYSCPDIQPYTSANLDANHTNIPKQTHDCVPVKCKMDVASDITVNPPIRGGCTITVFADYKKATVKLSNYCTPNQSTNPKCFTKNGDKITYTYNNNQYSKSNPCGSWTPQQRAGALGIYAFILKLEKDGVIK